MLDTERSAELEGTYSGIHAVFFIEDFAHNWDSHALTLLEFVGLNIQEEATKAGIKPSPIVGYELEAQEMSNQKERISPWLKVIDTCHVKKHLL